MWYPKISKESLSTDVLEVCETLIQKGIVNRVLDDCVERECLHMFSKNRPGGHGFHMSFAKLFRIHGAIQGWKQKIMRQLSDAILDFEHIGV